MTPPYRPGLAVSSPAGTNRFLLSRKSDPARTHQYSSKWLTISPRRGILNRMVEHSAHQLDEVFSALSDATRRRILEMVLQTERRVSEIAEPFAMSLAAVSKHLQVLERAGLLTRRREGRVHHIRANPEAMDAARLWIEQYAQGWQDGLDELARYLDAQRATARSRPSRNRKGGRSDDG